MLFHCILFFCVYVLIPVKHVAGNAEYDAPQEMKIFHTLDPQPEPEWLDNGFATLHNINTGSASLSQPPLSEDFLLELENAAANDSALYRLKYVLKTSKGKEISFYSFMKAKSLVEAGNVISIFIYLDPNGSVIGIKAFPDIKKKLSKSSSVTIKTSDQGPIPDTASYILKLEREREAKEKGATQDNRSFLVKYWMYLVPIVVVAILSGTGEGGGSSGR